ncbi:unnamed protein product [Rotaria sp. Silwood2]|nr:unnamed protein product [Rotaria sp. Silwood2]CAF4065784.1 unnamed protein product [Rotaria sp. Silwood2]
MSSDNKEPKRGSIQSFFRSSFKKKKIDISTAVDQSSQTHQPDETTTCSSDTTSKSLSSASQAVSLSSFIASPSPPPLPIETLPPLSVSFISSPTHYSSSTSSPTKCSSTISPSRCSSSMSSPKQRSPSISLSPLSLSPIAAAAVENSSIALDISRSSKELPTQPKLSSYPVNKQNRSFRSIWYSTFPWLEYSQQSDAFITGYNNWKNAMAKSYGFSRHETSASHKFACANYQQFILRKSTETTVINVIDKGRIELIRKNRQRLTKIASTVLLCSRQLISLRGNDESDLSNNRGNFIEILKWSSATDPLVNSILLDSADNASYLSPSIQNELIHLMANQIRKQIAEKVGGHVFSLMADEAKDRSGHEQLSIVLRCISHETWKNNDKIDRNSIFKEYLLGLVKLNEFDAEKELENEGDERSVDARGLLVALRVPTFTITLFIIHKIFGIIKILSDQLKAKTMDFCQAQYLIKSIIAKIADLRDEHTFSLIYTEITSFCQAHHIDLSSTPRQRRVKEVSSRFKDVFITSTIGQRDNLNNEDNYRIDLFYPIVDAVLIELNDRFSVHNMEILISISALCPDSENFLQSEILKPFAVEMKADICSLCNEIEVVKSMLKDSKLENIVDLYYQLLPLKQAFPTIISLIIIAMTIPVSSTTCERTFSKMKLIKTTTRNTMSDKRLNDLCVLAVERDFAIDFEKLMDDFADLHKNFITDAYDKAIHMLDGLEILNFLQKQRVLGLAPLSEYMFEQLNKKSNMYNYSSLVVNRDDADFEKFTDDDDDEAINNFNNDVGNNNSLFSNNDHTDEDEQDATQEFISST